MINPELSTLERHMYFCQAHMKHIQGPHFLKHWLLEIKIEILLQVLVFFLNQEPHQLGEIQHKN